MSNLNHAVNVATDPSPSFLSAYLKLKGRAKYARDAKTPGEPGVVAQTARGADEKTLAFAINWSAAQSDLPGGPSVAHELSHLRDVVGLGFTASEAARVLTLNQYKAYRWQAETDAFDFQSKVLSEIAKSERCPCPLRSE